jgi:hypothetical protein
MRGEGSCSAKGKQGEQKEGEGGEGGHLRWFWIAGEMVQAFKYCRRVFTYVGEQAECECRQRAAAPTSQTPHARMPYAFYVGAAACCAVCRAQNCRRCELFDVIRGTPRGNGAS